MNEYLLEAKEELKRLEHIIYVSLKYTRTVDVLTNALHRLVGTFDLIIEAFLEKAREEGRLAVLPKSPGLRVTKMREQYPEDKEIARFLSREEIERLLNPQNHIGRAKEACEAFLKKIPV